MLTLSDEWIDDVIANSIAIGRRVRDGSGWAASIDPAERLDTLQMRISLLKQSTGQDFGDNLDAYENWYAEHTNDWYKYSRFENSLEGSRI